MEVGASGVAGGTIGPGDEVMLGYGGAGATGAVQAMGPSGGGSGGGGSGGGSDLLGPTGDYSPQGTPTPLSHGVGTTVLDPQTAGGYATNAGGPTTYSPQDSPASSAGGGPPGAANGQLPSFGFTQEQVACVCEVRSHLLSNIIYFHHSPPPPAPV